MPFPTPKLNLNPDFTFLMVSAYRDTTLCLGLCQTADAPVVVDHGGSKKLGVIQILILIIIIIEKSDAMHTGPKCSTNFYAKL